MDEVSGNGFRLPDRSTSVSGTELAWLTFLRDLYGLEDVQIPSLRAIQTLRRVLAAHAPHLRR
ncbi:hypothetical protein GCM10011324_46160 [Allosediminivita pacifica]|nr:hypothetical protein GCM10011324_46160 [Allosediminivita pacifica]